MCAPIPRFPTTETHLHTHAIAASRLPTAVSARATQHQQTQADISTSWPPLLLPPRSTIDGTIHHPSDPASRSSGYDVPTVLAAIRVSELHHWAAPPIARVNNFSSQPAGQVTRAWNLGFGFGLEFGVGHHRKTQDAEPTPTTGRFDGGPGASSRRADGRTRIAMFHTLRQHAVIHRSRRAGLYRGRVHRLLGRLSIPELHQLRVDKPLRVGGRNRYPVHAL